MNPSNFPLALDFLFFLVRKLKTNVEPVSITLPYSRFFWERMHWLGGDEMTQIRLRQPASSSKIFFRPKPKTNQEKNLSTVLIRKSLKHKFSKCPFSKFSLIFYSFFSKPKFQMRHLLYRISFLLGLQFKINPQLVALRKV